MVSIGILKQPAQNKERMVFPAYAPEQHLFMDVLKKNLADYGFGMVDRQKMKSLQADKGIILHNNEVIFNRALGKDRKQSNFFVFMKRMVNKSGNSKVVVYFSDPEIKTEEKLLVEKRRDYLIREVFISGDEDAAAGKIADRILKCSQKKPENEYRKISHGHWGKIGEQWIADDGVSRFQDVIRTMMLYHIDYDATTPHNSFEENVFDYISQVEHEVGIVKIPATEITAALPPDGPNGPHLLLWMADKETAKGIKKELLDKRDDLKMRSYFSGMMIWDMLQVIEKYKEEGKLALAVAHPINLYSKSLPMYNIGLLSAAKSGKINIDTVEHIIALSDSVATWNPCIQEDLPSDPKPFRNYIEPLVQEHLGVEQLTSNAVNLAFALSMKEKYNVYTHYDPDDHETLPMNYSCGGDKYGMGFTQIILPFEKYQSLDAKPSSAQLIRMIHHRELGMNSVQFTVRENGAIKIARSREALPYKKQKFAEILAKEARNRYIEALANDFSNLLGQGKLDKLGEMIA